MPRNSETTYHNFSPENLAGHSDILNPLSVDLFYSDICGAEIRRNLYSEVTNLFNQIPDVSLDFDTALSQKLINPDQLSSFYNHFSDFIQSDPNHSRLILYLPFQTLPDLNNSNFYPNTLLKSQQKFVQVYKNAWIQQLFETDLRADFLDGDFLEPGLGTPTSVRKAAHLIPELLNRKIITSLEIDQIVESNPQDYLLQNSISEGLIASNYKSIKETEKTKFDLDQFTQELSQINNLSEFNRKRTIWKKSQLRQQLFDRTAQQISDSKIIESLFKIDSLDLSYKNLALKSIFNQNKLTSNFDNLIKNSWQINSTEIKNTLVTGLSCWFKKGIIDQNYLKQFNIKIPDLSLPLSVNLEQLKNNEFKCFFTSVEKIKSDPKLSQSLYPFFLTFGSHIKGYATSEADIDAAIFIKPNVSFENRQELISEIHQKLPELNHVEKILEFWMDDKNNSLSFRPNPGDINTIVGASEIHLLANGVWIGSPSETSKFSSEIIQKYLNLSNFASQKDQVRFYLLRQLEGDILQCRLLHKGYYSFYPDQKPSNTSSLETINGNSAFWDPGYRRVATQLFLSRVFLPDLSK